MKVISGREEVKQNFFGKETKCTHHSFIETICGIQNLIVGTEKGNIKVYNYPLISKNFEEFNAHHGEVTQVVVSPDSKYVFTTGTDGTIFVYSVTEYLNETEIYKPTALEEKKMLDKEFKNLIVDEGLADVVLIK